MVTWSKFDRNGALTIIRHLHAGDVLPSYILGSGNADSSVGIIGVSGELSVDKMKISKGGLYATGKVESFFSL